MYLTVNPPVAFPIALDPWEQPRGLGSAIPVAGLISSGLSIVDTAIKLILNSGCGVTCVETSDWANEAEQLLVQNIQTYFAIPPPRSQADQQQAIANFNAIWQQLQTNCGQSGTGTAGIKCISDREAGACTWKQTTTSPLLSIPGEPQPGACWNWFSGYLYPIQNDPDVAVASSDVSGDTGTLSSAGASITNAANTVASSVGLPSGSGTLLLLAAAALAVVLVVS
jgi:hypothetical protein